MRLNPDSLAHQQEVAAVTMVVQVVEDLVVVWEVAWAVVVVEVAAVKSTSPTFVTSLLFLWQLLSSFMLT